MCKKILYLYNISPNCFEKERDEDGGNQSYVLCWESNGVSKPSLSMGAMKKCKQRQIQRFLYNLQVKQQKKQLLFASDGDHIIDVVGWSVCLSITFSCLHFLLITEKFGVPRRTVLVPVFCGSNKSWSTSKTGYRLLFHDVSSISTFIKFVFIQNSFLY